MSAALHEPVFWVSSILCVGGVLWVGAIFGGRQR